MTISSVRATLDVMEVGREMYSLISDLYPICRSITGDGVRRTLGAVAEHIPLVIREVVSGTPVFDWTVPNEWNIKDAFVKDSAGRKVIDFGACNLHVVGYSTPIHRRMALTELKEHLFTLPDQPAWIPYRTSYYEENWGFCLSHDKLSELRDGDYEVCIDASLEAGHLTYGEYFIQGQSEDEVLLSCHTCHPSLCNDNLSGIAVLTFLARHLSSLSLRYSYRFLLVPGTIGAITWLSTNEEQVSRVRHGLVLACLGDQGPSTYKKSRQGDAEIDRVVAHVLSHSGQPYDIVDFSPYGYDERQFCSPGFDLAVGRLTRTPHGRYPEYHTSADNLDLVASEYLADSFSKCLAVLDVLEQNRSYVNLNPKCEPQLGKRGLYDAIGGQTDRKATQMAMLWVLNLSDGAHTLLDIADRSGLRFDAVAHAANALSQHGLLGDRDALEGTPSGSTSPRS